MPQQGGFKFGVNPSGGQGLKWQPPSFATNANMFKTGIDAPKIPVFSSVSLFNTVKPSTDLSAGKNDKPDEDSDDKEELNS